ncbi:hypothetical protein ACGFI3_29175 [Nonomuraea wenchangensis]|uniref:hypothetical protein n=1 Tax=Nonomuraea wenchangensis TaxID=568860 RepID=UPI00371ECBD9
MKLATAPIRPLVSLGVGLAMGATALLGAPGAAAAAPPEGAYWHSRSLMTLTHPWRFGSRSDPYALVQRRVSESWQAPDGRTWFGFRELGALPKSAADKKAWQRDGSPSKWSESIDGKTVKLSATPAKGSMNPVRGQNQFFLGGQNLTYDEVQRLPADPGTLKDWLRRAGQVGRVPSDALDGWVAGTLPELLHALPVTKEVRAAAYQALLTTPGVRADGVAKDTLGRSGAVVLIERGKGMKDSKDLSTTRLIVDTGRMLLLARSQKALYNGKQVPGKDSTETLVEVGWTNTAPAVPALP